MKKFLLISWLLLLASGISALFWYNDWKYTLPTPVPVHYQAVSFNNTVKLPEAIRTRPGKPLFLHFFNPDCPCSKFNMPHFRSLAKQYGAQAEFAIVVLSRKKYTVKEIQKRFDVDLPVYFDNNIAIACGVYSTPQAVIIDTDNKLFYRGNYNRNRYCTSKETEYARIALEGILQHNYTINFTQSALKAYGCQLPSCSK
jgi:hypothetical protein